MLTPTREAEARAFAQSAEAPLFVGELLAEIDRLRTEHDAEVT